MARQVNLLGSHSRTASQTAHHQHHQIAPRYLSPQTLIASWRLEVTSLALLTPMGAIELAWGARFQATYLHHQEAHDKQHNAWALLGELELDF